MAARKFNIFIFLSIGGCILSIVICGVALGTDQWFYGITKPSPPNSTPNSTQLDSGLSVTEISHGLFKGSKIKYGTQNQHSKFSLFVVCLVSDGQCMFSCHEDSKGRETVIRDLLDDPGNLPNYIEPCVNREDLFAPRPKNIPEVTDGERYPVFLSFVLWLMTIIFIAGAILFSVIGAALGLYNSFSAPFQPIMSVFGLYIWNGVAAGFILLTMIIWGITFTINLNKNAAISETLSGHVSSRGEGNLGFSYWILLAAGFLNLGNIVILRYRSWKIVNAERNNTKVMDVEMTKGEILLY